MGIEFSQHGREQIKRRGISRSHVLQTIENADIKEVTFRGRKLFRKRFGEKLLEVVAVEEDKELIIITAYYL